MKRLGKVLAAVLFPAGALLLAELIWGMLFSIIYGAGIIINLLLYKKDPAIMDNISNIIYSIIENPIYVNLATITGTLTAGILFLFWYLRLTRFEEKGYYKKVFSVKNLAIILVLGIGSQFFTSGGLSVLQPLIEPFLEDYSKVLENISSGNPILVVILVALAAPFTEELVFRGVMMKKLGRVLPFAAANIIQAAAFGIYHLNVIQGAYAFLLGMILGYVANRYKSISASIILHMAVNSSSYLMYLLPNYPAAYIILSAVGCLLLVVTLLQVKKVSYKVSI